MKYSLLGALFATSLGVMETKVRSLLTSYKLVDLALLYLRIAVGATLLLHNIGKIQNYNEVMAAYHSTFGLSAQFWFYAIAAVECIESVMLIIGLRVRWAASTLFLGTVLISIFYFTSLSQLFYAREWATCLIYSFLILSGGGMYSLDGVDATRKRL